MVAEHNSEASVSNYYVNGNLYKFKVHLGKKAFTGNAYAKGVIWAKFSNVLPQSQNIVLSQNIRESIGLLYICLDKSIVDKMTFGQLIWDQV